jgi:sugar phosphate isomerase/epimerase
LVIFPWTITFIKTPEFMSKRNIIAFSAVLLLSTQAFGLNEIPDEYRIGPFALGCQAYTFNRFTAFEAIEKTAAAGGRVIEFYPGQKLSPDSEVKLDHNATAEVIEKLQAKLKQHKVLAVNYGVVRLPNNEAECRKIFEFAKKLGLYAVTSEPEPAAFDVIEKMVKEYDIAMAIHNHPRKPNDPNYKYWDPEYIMSLVKNRDPRMGACADTGHFARSGLKVVEVLKTLEGRIISSHLKDIRPFGPRGADVPYGTGESDVIAILDEFKRQKIRGNISVEYESNMQNNVADVGQCIGFVRGYVQSKK